VLADTVGTPLTLEAALERALRVASRIGERSAGREAAELIAGPLNSTYLPTLSVSGSLTRSRFPSIVTPIREPGTFPPLSSEIGEVGLTLNWTFLDFGRGRAGRSAARFLADAAGAGEVQARMETMEAVTAHFVQLGALSALEAALRARLEGVVENERQLRALVEEGRLPSVDLLRMRELRLEAEVELRSTEAETERVLASLGSELRMDSPPSRQDVELPPFPAAPAWGGDAWDAPGGSEATGPMLDAARARLAAAEREVREARLALLPEVQLLSRQWLRSAPDVQTDRDWLVGIQVRVPVFRGDALTGIRIREARANERSHELERARLALEQALRDLRSAEVDARDRVQVLDARIGHLEEAFRIDSASHREGRTTLAELLSTEARLAAARAEGIGLRASVLLARLRVAALTGTLSVEGARGLFGDGS
jgi:outer membrane protein TolC